MKIGKLVQNAIPDILAYCETHDPAELLRLQDADYSKRTFDINYPFLHLAGEIAPDLQRRYYAQEYQVQGRRLRVTNHWFNPPSSTSVPRLRRYLAERGLPS
jgi:hypothetical protein